LQTQAALFASAIEAKTISLAINTSIATKNLMIKEVFNQADNFNMNDFLTLMSKDKI